MKFVDDGSVTKMLFRTDVMKPMGQTFSSFCQWCGDQKMVVKRGDRLLVCHWCDMRGDR